jgi:hypothetical protein
MSDVVTTRLRVHRSDLTLFNGVKRANIMLRVERFYID